MARVRNEENLDKATLIRVIGLLEQEKPITKKSACEILNISYNTTRLNKLISDFKEKEENAKKRRAKLRGIPLSNDELSLIAQEYLNGSAISYISELTYRSADLIKRTIKSLNIPIRDAEASYHNPTLIDDDALADDYKIDDLVYSVRYQSPALIDKVYTDNPDGNYYGIYILGPSQCMATQPYWELADLRRIQRDLKVRIKPMEGLQPSYNPKL